ncbi:MAG: hypothetical protein JO366_09945 [Methylobacteriaceae bacterium]|nr:hypothetical protein [Methylobacteriaceae bacterium]MBV9245119.1 hypothetical protein [Methylobacteriaceae bacterium]
MRELNQQERAALDAVAGHFNATWEKGGSDWADACMMISGKRAAVEVAAISERLAERGGLRTPRLRFDKAVLRTVGRLQALGEAVPDGEAVIVTITAPIRLPAKTAAALEDRIRMCLARRPAPVEAEDKIHGNRIRVRVMKGAPIRMSKVIGFVHNPDSDPEVLLHVTQSFLQLLGEATDHRPPKDFTGDRWLVVAHEDGLLHVQTYRHICSHLSIPTDFGRILMVLAGGRVETLIG